MDPSKALVTCAGGLVLGGISAAIWTAIDEKKKKKARPESLVDSIASGGDFDPKARPRAASHAPSTSSMEGIDSKGEGVFTYPHLIRVDAPLIEALELLRTKRRGDAHDFLELVASLTRLQHLWWRTESADPKFLQRSTRHKAMEMRENIKAVLESYCVSAAIPLKDIPGYRFRYGPVHPQFRRAFTQVLTSADNMRHNTEVAYEIVRAKGMKQMANREVDRRVERRAAKGEEE
jgi:hypothetical protein